MNPSYSNGRPVSVSAMDESLNTGSPGQDFDTSFRSIDRGTSRRLDTSIHQGTPWPASSNVNFGSIGTPLAPISAKAHSDYEPIHRSSPDRSRWEQDSPSSRDSSEFPSDVPMPRGSANIPRPQGRSHSQRRPSNRDEFDGPHQFLERPSTDQMAAQERDLPHVPTNLYVQEQDDVLSQVNDRLSQCAFDFVAKYQFPIPLEPDKRPVSRPADREWTEWVYLLKRLATKRRIPARVLYNGQIKQLVTVLENSLEMRHAAKHQSRPLKDDRNVLQLISAGLQVAKILRDAEAMRYLDQLYLSTEKKIQGRVSGAGSQFGYVVK